MFGAAMGRTGCAAANLLKRMAPQVGLESAFKRSFNNLQGHGWHRRLAKAVVGQQTERK